jgi:hypothetical protein
MAQDDVWPSLGGDGAADTFTTLHLWTQIAGKVRLVHSPWTNHSWHVTLYVTARGLTTSPIPHGARTFELTFDFADEKLRIDVDDGRVAAIALRPRTVAEFYAELMATLELLGLGTRIHTMPNEIADAIPFPEDHRHAAYDPVWGHRLWQALVRVERVFKEFRSHFIGKCSPVHFFWGSFDLAVTRFSGRTAPPHPGGVPHFPDWVAREAYSHEVSSAGFWPGTADAPPMFYSYAYPEPPGFRTTPVRPAEARFDEKLAEFVLPYEAVRRASDPEAALHAFLQSTYEAAADTAKWDRAALERERFGP